MAPSKTARSGHEDVKSETTHSKEKNAHSSSHQTNGKLRRVASSSGTNAKEAPAHAPAAHPPAAAATAAHEALQQPLDWPTFDRGVLHNYRRAHRLTTSAAAQNEYRRLVLTQSGSIGLMSPTIARARKEFVRQSREQLAGVVRKHFNDQGYQENDIIVDFIHKCRAGKVHSRLDHHGNQIGGSIRDRHRG